MNGLLFRAKLLFFLLLSFVMFFIKTNQVQASSQSQTETISYKTSYHNRTYEKEAIVYLPPNYNKNQKHNVLYLLHGLTEVKKRQIYFISGWEL